MNTIEQLRSTLEPKINIDKQAEQMILKVEVEKILCDCFEPFLDNRGYDVVASLMAANTHEANKYIGSVLERFDFDFGRPKERNTKGTSIRIPMKLTLEEMYSGVTKKVKYKRFEPCGHCGGSGMTSESKKKVCRSCGGSGTVFGGNSFMAMTQTCPTCGGQGYIIEKPCSHCHGHGIVQKVTDETEIKLNKGLLDGMNVILGGKGNFPPHGKGTPGDLIISIQAIPNDNFDIDGNDLYFPIELNIVDAILGCNVDVNTVDGKQLTAKIPSGTSDGHKLRFRGYGIPIYGTNKAGDMLGIVKINIPKNVTEEEKELLLKLKEHENFK